MKTTKEFTYNIDHLDGPETTSGARVNLYLDTKEREVFTHRFIGNGYLNRADTEKLGDVTGLVGDYLEKFLREIENKLSDICEADDENDEDFFTDRENLVYEFQNWFQDQPIAKFWEAHEWFGPAACEAELLEHAFQMGSKEAALAEVEEAKADGAYLNVEDVQEYIESIPERYISDLQDAKDLIDRHDIHDLQAEWDMILKERDEVLVISKSGGLSGTIFDNVDDVIETLTRWAKKSVTG